MPETADSPEGQTNASRRSRRRRNVIAHSPHREEYERLIKAGWNSFALERYALGRYGEEIPASTFRSYKSRKGMKTDVERFGEIVDQDKMIDVMGVRSDLIQLQMGRIGIDVRHEQEMSKLFGSTRGEIQLLSALLDQHKQDLQDLGMFPKVGESVTIESHVTHEQVEDTAPKHTSLSEALGMDGADDADLAEVLHLQLKRTGTDDPSSNGHGE